MKKKNIKRSKTINKLKSRKIIAATAAIISIVVIFYIIFAPIKFDDDSVSEIRIPLGSSLGEIAGILKSNDLIRSEPAFKLFIMALGQAKGLKAGNYSLSKSLSMFRISLILTGGYSDLDEVRVTIHEGTNVWEIDKILTDAGVIEEGQFSSKFYGDEGYLFPDTYLFRKKDSRERYLSLHGEISSTIRKDEEIEIIGERMKENFIAQTQDLFEGLDSDEVHRIIIIASMLEKEVYTYNEMRLVAGIIKRRIEIEMPLQIDATVSYGACLRDFTISGFSKNCNVSFVGVRDEIKIDSEYNSYMRQGLPVGPISNPGLLAIKSAMNPKSSNYLYYLSPRGSIETIFSQTGIEHEANRKKYLGI